MKENEEYIRGAAVSKAVGLPTDCQSGVQLGLGVHTGGGQVNVLKSHKLSLIYERKRGSGADRCNE